MKAIFRNSDAGLEQGWPEAEYEIEAEWLQLTYGMLRIAPNGDPIAMENNGWGLTTGTDVVKYTDVVIVDSDS